MRSGFSTAAFALTLASALFFTRPAQATWSIAGVDNATGEVGGAAATCVPGLGFTGDGLRRYVHHSKPGLGVVHSQADTTPEGQRSEQQLDSTNGAQDIIQFLADHYAGNYQMKQWGVVLLDSVAATRGGQPAAAVWTGNLADFSSMCGDTAHPERCADHYSGGRPEGISPDTGRLHDGKLGLGGSRFGNYTYSVQANTMTGPEVLNQAVVGFRGGCDLAEGLMRALESGALNAAGDVRCRTNDGRGDPSSLAAFIQVKRVGDENYLKLTTTMPDDPDAVKHLRQQFDAWRQTHPCPAPFVPACGNGVDDNGNGRIDFGQESFLECKSTRDVSERGDCSDGLDNNGDGIVDGADALCEASLGSSEEDFDDDGIPNDADDNDARLDIRALSVRAAAGGASVAATGTFAPHLPFDDFSVDGGVLVTLQSAGAPMAFTVTDCQTKRSSATGRVSYMKCYSTDRLYRARFRPKTIPVTVETHGGFLKLRKNGYKFDLRLSGLTVTPTLGNQATLTITTSPARRVWGVDRVGTVPCVGTTCRPGL